MKQNNKEPHDEIEVYGGTGDKPVFKDKEEQEHWSKLFNELREEHQGGKKKQWKEHKLGWEKKYPDDINKFESEEQLIKFLEDCIITIQHFETEYAIKELDRVFNRTRKENFVLAQEINDFISTSQGTWFYVGQIYNRLQLSTRQEKKNVVTCLLREREKGVIESHPSKNGCYRQIVSELEPIDWKNAPATPLPLKWPLGLEALVDIYCGNTMVVAGDANSGKSSFAFNFIEMNMSKWNIDYYSSEMGDSELGLRLSKFKDVKQWKFNAYERSANWSDVVKPDNISVIDFLEILDEFWQVGKIISNIHQKLVNGIALIMIQKSPGAGLGRGASFGTEKPRLYLTLESGRAKIVKAKNWAGIENPNGLITEFSIVQGAKMTQKGVWYHEGDDPLYKKGRF